MRSLASLSFAFFFSYAAAQVATIKIIPFSTLPQCAQICPALNAANDVCVPPAVPETNDDTYTDCVCASQQLAGLQQNANAVCTDVCTAQADLEAIQAAFNQLCNVVAPQDPNDPNTNPTNAAPSGPSNTARPVNNNDEDAPWISTHWQWIIFAVVLVVGMIGFSILGVWLKRRHRRRVDARNSNLASTDAIPPAGGVAGAAAASSNRSLPATAHGSTHTREMTQSPSGMGMASGVAPPRRTFTGRSRSSTVNSHSGPVVWGPHQNMAATRPYDNVPPSPVYAGAGAADDYDDRSNHNGHVYSDHQAPPSPISPAEGSDGGYPAHNFSRKNTNGAGAQRIREMRSQESVERSRSRTGTPNSAGGRR